MSVASTPLASSRGDKPSTVTASELTQVESVLRAIIGSIDRAEITASIGQHAYLVGAAGALIMLAEAGTVRDTVD